LQEGLPRARRHPRHADQRGGALDRSQVTAVILAGGQGTRLRPLTLHTPKPIVPLLNVPFLAYQLDLLRRHGVTDVVLSCSYMVDEVRRTLADGAAYGVKLRYAVEVEPLGTAGGVRNAMDLVGGLVLVLNGDVLTDADLSAMLGFHAARGAVATIDLFPVPDPRAYGLVETGPAGRVLRFIEKPEPSEVTTDTINAGIYLLERELLARIPEDKPSSIEREFFPGLLADGLPFFGWVGRHYWLDIGSPAKYRQAQQDLMAGMVETTARQPPDAAGRAIAAEVAVAPTATITGPCVIGAGSRLEPGCRVGPGTVLGEGCVVGQGATVSGAILWSGVSVGGDAILRDCIIGAGARLGVAAQVGPGVVIEAGRVVPDHAHLDA
jgi:NDP-sugar pyrophosphorylase family protein